MSKSIEVTGLINGQLYGFRMFPRNLKGQYQTETDGATATATPKAFVLPTYTGSYSIFGNEAEGRIEMYTSGTLTLSPATYDMFVVGGGGGATINGSAGGGGGYTKTLLKNIINNNQTFDVSIGSGTIGEGGQTIISNVISVLGGKKGEQYGGDGGSGGGGRNSYKNRGGGQGGADGEDGTLVYTGNLAGIGQHTTTRAFGEPTGTLYAGGGGGYGKATFGANGGSGGGGQGGIPYVSGTDGTPNTGGGGGGTSGNEGTAGGSGIAIVRWKRN